MLYTLSFSPTDQSNMIYLHVQYMQEDQTGRNYAVYFKF